MDLQITGKLSKDVSVLASISDHNLPIQADGYTQKMLWGRPQPETVSDYELSVESPTGWQTIETAQNNHQRLRRHILAERMTTTALRLHITATNGLDHARVVEVRAYG